MEDVRSAWGAMLGGGSVIGMMAVPEGSDPFRKGQQDEGTADGGGYSHRAYRIDGLFVREK